MSVAELSGALAIAAADAVVDDLIRAALAGSDRARLTNAPAGAGKTGAVVKLLGAQASAGARVGVVTQTNAQAFDLVKRAAEANPGHTIGFMRGGGVTLPTATALLKNVRIAEPTCIGTADVIVATADKWAYSRPRQPRAVSCRGSVRTLIGVCLITLR